MSGYTKTNAGFDNQLTELIDTLQCIKNYRGSNSSTWGAIVNRLEAAEALIEELLAGANSRDCGTPSNL